MLPFSLLKSCNPPKEAYICFSQIKHLHCITTHTARLPRYLLTLVFLAVVCGVSRAQLGEPQPKFHNYTVEDGLPGSEAYFVHQDRKGYIWICTDRGVSRFDGNKFQNFTTADGLTDNVIFKIFEDYKGRIWFISFNSELCYFENGKIKAYAYNHKIRTAQKNQTRIAFKNFYIDKNDNVYLSVMRNGMWIIDRKGHMRTVKTNDKLLIESIDGHLMWMYDGNPKKHPFAKIVYRNWAQSVHLPDYNLQQRISIASSPDEDYVLLGEDLYAARRNKKIWHGLNPIEVHYVDGMLWISRMKEGVICFPDVGDMSKKFTYLKGLSVSCVHHDKEGGYWFTTLEKGVFYSPSLAVKNYTLQQGLIDDEISSIAGIRDNIYLGFQIGKWQHMKNPAWKQEYGHGPVTILGNSKRKFYVSVDGTFELDQGKVGRKLYQSWASDFYCYKNSVLFGLFSIFRKYDDGRQVQLYDYRTDDIAHKSPSRAIMMDDNGMLWVGGLSGLYQVRDGKMSNKDLKDPLFRTRVTDLGSHPLWKNIVATRGSGLYFFDNYKVIQQIGTKNGLLSNLINTIFVDDQGGLWVGTNKGLNYLVKNKQGKITISEYTIFHGLCSNEISSIYVYDGMVYVGTKGGLSVIDTKKFRRNHQVARVYVTSFETSTKRLNPAVVNTLSHKESYLKIVFGNTNYRTLGANRVYQYRFNKKSEWITTDVPEITLINPLPGDYNLEIRYTNEDGVVSLTHNACRFTIGEAFYNRWYFFLGLAVLIALIAWRLFRLRITQLKQRHYINNKISQLEQKALQAQMNPHFIFNALNSIQSFLVYDENEKAEKYLLKFAQLIRQTLSNSREPYVTISGEIDILEKYLDLERMRFRNKFKYTIVNHLKSSDMDLKIPSMLIQPFVENSVIHGFSTLDAGGEITITLMSADETQILCKIEDNGIGRKKAMKQSAKTHVSFGTTITEERLKAFETKHGMHFRIETIDIEQEDGTTGTIVWINLPVI